MDAFLARLVVWPTFNIGLFGSKLVDRGIIEFIGPYGLSVFFNTPFGFAGAAIPGNSSNKTEYIGGNLPYYAIYTALVALAAPILFMLSGYFAVLVSSPTSAITEPVQLAGNFELTTAHILVLFALILALIVEADYRYNNNEGMHTKGMN